MNGMVRMRNSSISIIHSQLLFGSRFSCSVDVFTTTTALSVIQARNLPSFMSDCQERCRNQAGLVASSVQVGRHVRATQDVFKHMEKDHQSSEL